LISAAPTRPIEGASGYRLERVETISSTSDACVARAKQGEADGLAILARTQTAARGSRGRDWSAPVGNLFLSVLLRPRNAAELGGAGQWALLAGLALVETLSTFDREPEALNLKWPNDVLRGGAKLAGVLVDAAMTENGTTDWLVIGVGANLAVAPVIEGRQIAVLAGRDGATPDAVADHFLGRIAHWRTFLALSGFAPVRAGWMARAHPAGTAVTVRQGSHTRAGTFAGLSAEGALQLLSEGNVHTISTGDVLLGQGG
jgi:BirA family transcriptional regulator, biotin operon repressor / biotin---[acetyl-CoA-carboxylase] ligase